MIEVELSESLEAIPLLRRYRKLRGHLVKGHVARTAKAPVSLQKQIGCGPLLCCLLTSLLARARRPPWLETMAASN
jgi:hypothetical protein